MLEKPKLSDDKISACIHDLYGIESAALEFLPIGNNNNTWVYKLTDAQAKCFFLKVNRAALNVPSILIPRFLYENGIRQVIAPLPTTSRQIVAALEDYHLILYPFIQGENAMRRGMSATQWVEFGSILQQIHSIPIPQELEHQLVRETFTPYWTEMRRAIETKIQAREFENDAQRELAAFWNEKSSIMTILGSRAQDLGKRLQTQTHEFVLCHADIHTANILIDENDQLYVVDWDQPMLAPRERDFLFVIDSAFGNHIPDAYQELFFQGYGKVEIHWAALAYYRYHWAMTDLCEFAACVFLIPDAGAETQADAVEWFKRLFQPGNSVELALREQSIE